MKTTRWLTRGAALLVLLLLAVNVYHFLTKEWESSFAPTSYATLYYPLDVPTIRSWTVVNRDRLQLNLVCAKEIGSWRVLTDGGNEQTATGMTPSFRIDTTHAQIHAYRLIPLPEGTAPPIELTIRFYSREFYGGLGMDHDDVYIVRSNVACGEFDQLRLADWVDEYSYVGAEGLVETEKILSREVGIRDADPTLLRIEKLLPYLRSKLKECGGVPKDDERWMNPWVLYNELVAGTGKGWCTQNAQVWVYWANRAGIPTRFVFNARTEKNTIVYTGHAFAESFIKEQNRWAFVDLSQGQAYITNKNGEVLNTVELLQLNMQNAFDGTTARLSADWQWKNLPGVPSADTMMSVPFSLCNTAVREEFTPHSILKYRLPPNVEDVRSEYTGFYRDWAFLAGNLERYLFKPQLAYSFYPTEGGTTYFVRRLLFLLLVASVALWLGIVAGVRHMKKRIIKKVE